MPIDLSVLARRTDPNKTALFLGAGSSIPSGAPSANALAKQLSDRFAIQSSKTLSLASVATIVEVRYSRRELIDALTRVLGPLQPTRGILTLPDHPWAGIYTTNYDELIEKAYALQNTELSCFSSNFDFTSEYNPASQHLYKLHGTISRDTSLGHQHRLVISPADYDLASDYRELLYGKLVEQMSRNSVVIIGHSLADPDLTHIVDNALRLKRSKGAPGKITVLCHEPDPDLALVYGARGLDVCFAGIDQFLAEMSTLSSDTAVVHTEPYEILDHARSLVPSTIVVSGAAATETARLSRMFNGSAANYADIAAGWTFERDFADHIETQFADTSGKRIAYVLGTAGSGKTTGVRKALSQLSTRGLICWEHVNDFPLQADAWMRVDGVLRDQGRSGVLLIDDAHRYLREINTLVEGICRHDITGLRVLLVSSKPHWNPRLKSPAIFTHGHAYKLGSLSDREIGSLLDTLEAHSDVAALVERRFLGFTRSERRRRLANRCRADMFVCMKNLFASESFDDIILREYAELTRDYQSVYKQVAGMQSAGIRVHRQLVIRTIGVQSEQISRYLEDLDGILEERTVSARRGVFSWQVRHDVIADIVSHHKLVDDEERFALLSRTIDNLNPSYGIEIDSINDICDPNRGLGWIYDKQKQNVLLRKMISLAPQQRVPRHRLITNLIALEEYESANSEIRLFENELRRDGPVQRYKVRLALERAEHTLGILREDRVALIRKAAQLAEVGVRRFRDDKNLYKVYLEAGLAHVRIGGDRQIFDRAMDSAKAAYDRILDPDLARTIAQSEALVVAG